MAHLTGNGKTLRTERMAELYVPGWVSMSGPSSAKAGMQVGFLAQINHPIRSDTVAVVFLRGIRIASTAPAACTTR